MTTKEVKRKGPILCAKDGEWKKELEKRLKTDERITLTALGKVKYDLLAHIHSRKDIEIVKLETRYMRKRKKGMGLKVIIRKRKETSALSSTKV